MNPPPVDTATPRKVAVIAGEASGDALGGDLITHLQDTFPHLHVAGVGGQRLRAAGCDCWWDISELEAFGLVEVLRHLPRLLRLRKQLRRRLLAWQPDVVITIDAPDFNLPLAARLKQHGIRVVHYVCPSVWAWRQNRVFTLARSVDHVLCLLPFERDFLSRHNVPATFVGHPAAERIGAEQPARDALRREHGLSDDKPLIAVLPGSRDSELKRLLPAFLQAVARLETSPLILTALTRGAHHEWFREWHRQYAPGVSVKVLEGDHAAHTALRLADAALLASGTVTLEAMLCGCPMVVAYRLQPLTWQILKQFRLYKAKYVSLPNLLADQRLVPEILQNDVTPERLANELHSLLDQDRQPLREHFAQLSTTLRRHAGRRAATVVTELL